MLGDTSVALIVMLLPPAIPAAGPSWVENWPEGGEAALGQPLTTFFVVGDWGRRGNLSQRVAAELMGQVAQRLHPEFIISAGGAQLLMGCSCPRPTM
jgi:hypothetical protein